MNKLYETVDQLPDAVKGALSTEPLGLQLWLEVYNALAKAGAHEDYACWYAYDALWAAGFYKEASGAWTRGSIPINKAGKTFSEKNRQRIQAAIDALQAMLDETTDDTTDDTTAKQKPVAKRRADGGVDLQIPLRKSADKQMVFGWASVAADKDGTPVIDAEGDTISIEELEAAAYEYMVYSRDAGEQHERTWGIGRAIESLVFTPEKLAAMDIPAGTVPYGWWIGLHIEDSEVWEKLKDGDYLMFSIGGSAQREVVE